MRGLNKFLETRSIFEPPSDEEPLKRELLQVLFMHELNEHLAFNIAKGYYTNSKIEIVPDNHLDHVKKNLKHFLDII